MSSAKLYLIDPKLMQTLKPGNSDNPQRALQFDASYYRSHCGPVPYDRSEPQWACVFGAIADQIIRALKPRKVLDVGCALGFLVEAFWDRGVDARGLDISRFAIDRVRSDLKPYCRLASAAERIEDGPFDLVTCIEVLEHMPEADALSGIKNMTEVCEAVLFSSSPYDFDEPTHVNVHPIGYWLRAFQAHGFLPDLLFDASFVCPHAMLLRRNQELDPDDVSVLFGWMLDLRHRLTERTNQFNEKIRDLAAAETGLAENSASLDKLRSELGAMTEQLQQTRVSAQRQELELQGVRAELTNTKSNLNDAERLQDRIREELDAAATQIAAYLRHEAEHSASRPLAQVYDVSSIESRLAMLENQVGILGHAVDDIATSKIWRSLVRIGGILQMLLPSIGKHR